MEKKELVGKKWVQARKGFEPAGARVCGEGQTPYGD